MGTWRRKLIRSAWTALLLVFAVRAVAGTALCELYGEHGAPAGTAQAITVRDHSAPERHRAAQHEHRSSGEAPSKDRSEHACVEAVQLIGGPAAVSATKAFLEMGAIAACAYAPAGLLRPVAVAARISPHCLERPPPLRAPLDIAPRLRI
jgi:hypothetical protein